MLRWKLAKPLITLACNEDMTASDLVGRFLLDVNGTHWQDGPLTRAVREGAICYLNEVVEARQDTVVVLHPLTGKRAGQFAVRINDQFRLCFRFAGQDATEVEVVDYH